MDLEALVNLLGEQLTAAIGTMTDSRYTKSVFEDIRHRKEILKTSDICNEQMINRVDIRKDTAIKLIKERLKRIDMRATSPRDIHDRLEDIVTKTTDLLSRMTVTKVKAATTIDMNLQLEEEYQQLIGTEMKKNIYIEGPLSRDNMDAELAKQQSLIAANSPCSSKASKLVVMSSAQSFDSSAFLLSGSSTLPQLPQLSVFALSQTERSGLEQKPLLTSPISLTISNVVDDSVSDSNGDDIDNVGYNNIDDDKEVIVNNDGMLNSDKTSIASSMSQIPYKITQQPPPYVQVTQPSFILPHPALVQLSTASTNKPSSPLMTSVNKPSSLASASDLSCQSRLILTNLLSNDSVCGSNSKNNSSRVNGELCLLNGSSVRFHPYCRVRPRSASCVTISFSVANVVTPNVADSAIPAVRNTKEKRSIDANLSIASAHAMDDVIDILYTHNAATTEERNLQLEVKYKHSMEAEMEKVCTMESLARSNQNDVVVTQQSPCLLKVFTLIETSVTQSVTTIFNSSTPSPSSCCSTLPRLPQLSVFAHSQIQQSRLERESLILPISFTISNGVGNNAGNSCDDDTDNFNRDKGVSINGGGMLNSNRTRIHSNVNINVDGNTPQIPYKITRKPCFVLPHSKLVQPSATYTNKPLLPSVASAFALSFQSQRMPANPLFGNGVGDDVGDDSNSSPRVNGNLCFQDSDSARFHPYCHHRSASCVAISLATEMEPNVGINSVIPNTESFQNLDSKKECILSRIRAEDKLRSLHSIKQRYYNDTVDVPYTHNTLRRVDNTTEQQWSYD